jgi:protease-4
VTLVTVIALMQGTLAVAQSTSDAGDGQPASEAATTSGEEASTTDEATSTKKRAKVRFAKFVLEADVPESPGQTGLFGEIQTDLAKTIERIEKAAEDSSIQGVILEVRQPLIGRGRAEELRCAIQRLRDHGKKAYAYLDVATPVDYLIALACDEIVMPETGYLTLPGVHAEAMFYKGLLEKVGVEADFMHIGPYKSAAQPFMHNKLTPEVRENLTAVVDDIYDQLVTTIAADRLMTVDQVKAVIDTGLLTANDALKAGLVDRVEYPDAIRQRLADEYGAEPLAYVKNYGKKEVDTDFSGPLGFVKLLQLMMGVSPDTDRSRSPKIAVVYAVGPIMTGESEQSPLGGGVMGSTTIVEALREAEQDDQVAAIVLRIDSPGGSAVASDLIWRETCRIEKPIVASMSDVAGSGGYYIAMGADKIYAAPGTITGSIGVVSGKFGMAGLYEKIGITTDTIQRGQNSGMFGSSNKFTESERAVMQKFMEDIYLQFTTKAAAGRKMNLDDLQELAEGRIYTGRQAKRVGLIDELGTLEDAIAAAKGLAGLDEDEQVRIKALPEPTNVFESLMGDLDAEEEEVRISQAIGRLAPELTSHMRQVTLLRRVLQEPAVVLMPYRLEIR